MRTETKHYILGMLACVAIVSAAAFVLGAIAHADGPSKDDYAALAMIKSNQTVIAKNRAAYDAFVKAKNENEAQVTLLNHDGWNVDWSNMTLVPISFQ